MWPHDLKLHRARKHLEELDAEIGRWVEGGGYTIRVEPDPQPFEADYEVKAYITEPLGEDPFSLLIGDFLQNARAALDYVAFALGDAGAGGAMPDEIAIRAGFPIIGDVDREGFSGRGPDLFADAADRQLSTVPEPARAVIEQLQPYYASGESWRWDELRVSTNSPGSTRSAPVSKEGDLETTTMNAATYSPIAPLFRVCDGVRIRFADNRADSSAVTVLMLSPWPESLWAFRGIWDRVSGVARIVAIDLPGFGHSDGRPELIAPDALGTFLARLIEEWDLGAPHVVGPDVGTAAALFLAANAPERVTSLTIGGGAVRAPIDAGGALKDVIEAPSLDVVRQLDARTNIGFAVEPAAAADSEPDVHEDYVSAYDLGRFAESARFVRHYPKQNPVLRGLLPTITTPTQIIAGREDDLVPWSNNKYLADLLPNSEIHPLDAGHFAWEQASDEYGRLIVEWVTGGFQRLAGAVTA